MGYVAFRFLSNNLLWMCFLPVLVWVKLRISWTFYETPILFHNIWETPNLDNFLFWIVLLMLLWVEEARSIFNAFVILIILNYHLRIRQILWKVIHSIKGYKYLILIHVQLTLDISKLLGPNLNGDSTEALFNPCSERQQCCEVRLWTVIWLICVWRMWYDPCLYGRQSCINNGDVTHTCMDGQQCYNSCLYGGQCCDPFLHKMQCCDPSMHETQHCQILLHMHGLQHHCLYRSRLQSQITQYTQTL